MVVYKPGLVGYDEGLMNDLLKLTLIELVEAIGARKTSPVELMEAVLSRIDATHAELNAVVAMRDREELLTDASASEKRVMKGEAGALEGIPFGVKDLEDVGGLTTTMGSEPGVASCNPRFYAWGCP